jgi:hypothetical protein
MQRFISRSPFMPANWNFRHQGEIIGELGKEAEKSLGKVLAKMAFPRPVMFVA